MARITKTQGLKGAVRIEQMLEDDAVFQPGRPVLLSGRSIEDRDAEIEFFRRQHGRSIIKLREIDSISEAAKYIGVEIRIRACDLPAPREGWFYTFELRGCEVFTAEGEWLGTVTEVLDPGGCEILKVDREGEETLIPFAESYMKRIDPDQRRIEVDLPEGLKELNK